MRQAMREQGAVWRRRGYQLDFGVGIALGYATLGQIGFEGNRHYGAIGSVANMAARLSGQAEGGQILVTQRVYAEVEALVEAEPLGERTFKGFSRPQPTYNVLGLKA